MKYPRVFVLGAGYIYIRVKDKRIAQHRYIMEQVLGRKLETDEIVHHKNGIKTDNRIENLQLVTKTTHRAFHPNNMDKAIPRKALWVK